MRSAIFLSIRALKYLLGLQQAPPGATCHLKHVKDDSRCDDCIDTSCSHPVSCRAGPGVLRVHASVQQILLEACKAAGCHARKEVVVPFWSYVFTPRRRGSRTPQPRVIEAWLDVVAHSCTGESFFNDATVRNPLAPRYLVSGRSSTQDGYACAVAVEVCCCLCRWFAIGFAWHSVCFSLFYSLVTGRTN